MAGGHIFASGHRLSVVELPTERFEWSIFSIDGSHKLMTGVQDYSRFEDAKRAGLKAYKANGSLLNRLDMEKPRKQQPTWPDQP